MTTMSVHKPHPPPLPAEDDDDVRPDTQPDTEQDGELLEAIQWLKRAGVVRQDERPAFAGFFDEVVNSAEGDPEP